jgi:hypothetical protein
MRRSLPIQRNYLYNHICYINNMGSKLIAQPFRGGGPSSKYWVLHIPSPIVKEYGINETTNFLVEYGDYGITLYYANIEPKMGNVGLGLENFGPQIPCSAGGKS